MLNRLKIMGNFTFIYTHHAFSSKNNFQKNSNLHVAHVWIMSKLIFNWEWTKTQLRVNFNLIKSELKINYEFTRSELRIKLEWTKG
jgi:hypothetical protein